MAHAQPWVPSLLWSQAPEEAWLFLFFLVSCPAVNSQIFFFLIGNSEVQQLLQHLTKCWDVLCACICIYIFKADLIGRVFSVYLYMSIFVESLFRNILKDFQRTRTPCECSRMAKSAGSPIWETLSVLWFTYDKSAFWQPTQSGYPLQEV